MSGFSRIDATELRFLADGPDQEDSPAHRDRDSGLRGLLGDERTAEVEAAVASAANGEGVSVHQQGFGSPWSGVRHSE